MITVALIIHIILCIGLVLIVLLQTGRGADIGAAFGGGSSQTLFGSSGTSSFMAKLTTSVVILFMVTSLFLAWAYSHRGGTTTVKTVPVPVEQKAPEKGTSK